MTSSGPIFYDYQVECPITFLGDRLPKKTWMRMFRSEWWRGELLRMPDGDARVVFYDYSTTQPPYLKGLEEVYERAEFLIYSFSLVRPRTLECVLTQLAPQLSHLHEDKKVIILAFDRDLMDRKKRSQWERGMQAIPREDIDKSIRYLNAYAYIEWNASDDKKSYEQLRDTVMRIHLTGKKEIKLAPKEEMFPSGCEVA